MKSQFASDLLNLPKCLSRVLYFADKMRTFYSGELGRLNCRLNNSLASRIVFAENNRTSLGGGGTPWERVSGGARGMGPPLGRVPLQQPRKRQPSDTSRDGFLSASPL